MKHQKLKPCPFCGSIDMIIENTWTASYWVECVCGAEVHGKAYGNPTNDKKPTNRQHGLAIVSAMKKWNARVV